MRGAIFIPPTKRICGFLFKSLSLIHVSSLYREDTGFLTKPSWLLDSTDSRKKEFVRFFGQIEPRKSSLKASIYGVNDCAANHAVIFKESPIFISGKLKLDLRVQRHFAYDSLLTGQFEISVTNVLPKSGTQLKLTEDHICALISHFLDQKVNILNPAYKKSGNKGTQFESKLYQLPTYIPDAYCKASTSVPKYSNIESWWVQGGRECLFLEIKGNEDIELPSRWKNVIWESGYIKRFEFYRANIEHRDQIIPILIFKGVSAKDYKVAREVRFFALTLLAASECLSIFRLNAKNNLINQEQLDQQLIAYREKTQFNASFYKCVIDETRGLFEDRFSRATLFRLKEARGGLLDKVSNLLNGLTTVEAQLFFQKVDDLLSRIGNVHPNFSLLAIKEITVTYNDFCNANIQGIVNIDNVMNDVVQTINSLPHANAGEKAELENLVKELLNILKDAAEDNPERIHELEKVTKLTKRATEDAKTDLFNITAEGLKDAAKASVDIAPLAVNIVGNIIELLR